MIYLRIGVPTIVKDCCLIKVDLKFQDSRYLYAFQTNRNSHVNCLLPQFSRKIYLPIQFMKHLYLSTHLLNAKYETRTANPCSTASNTPKLLQRLKTNLETARSDRPAYLHFHSCEIISKAENMGR